MRIARAAPVTLASALAASAAFAQTETPHKHRQGHTQAAAPGGPKTPPPIIERTAIAPSGAARTARDRMKRGDCAGALDAFDQAIEERPDDLTLRRDRGICHDKLGQPYPAIEDYRAYLVALPDAPDAQGLRTRFVALEDQVAGRAPASGPEAAPVSEANDDAPPKEKADDDAPPKEPALAGGDAPGADPDAPPSAAQPKPEEADDDAPRSPLRGGRGWAIAPFVNARKWFRDGLPFGDRTTWAECVGGEVRYAAGARTALLLEAGYERFDTTSTDAETAAGLTSLLELELRFPLNARYDDQVLVAPGAGYESVSYSPGSASSSAAYSEGAVTARLRLSYRHMLAESVALDTSIDGGFAQFFHLSDAAADPQATSAALAGLNVAVLWGF